MVSSSAASESWETISKKIIDQIWEIKGAEIFQTPVDYLSLGLMDYPLIIKNPMDFGTIKVIFSPLF